MARHARKGWSLRLRLFSLVDLSSLGCVALNLRLEFLDSGKLLFRSKVIQKSDLDVLAINLLIEIEQMKFEDPLSCFLFDRGANANVHDAAILAFSKPGFRRVDPIRWELFVVRVKVRSRKP